MRVVTNKQKGDRLKCGALRYIKTWEAKMYTDTRWYSFTPARARTSERASEEERKKKERASGRRPISQTMIWFKKALKRLAYFFDGTAEMESPWYLRDFPKCSMRFLSV